MSSLSVKGKLAIVTGAGSGINLAFANLLLQHGCSVVIGDLALRPEAEELISQFPQKEDGSGPSAIFHQTDVTSWPALSSLFEKALSSFGRVDIVVPGAGVFEPQFSAFWNPPKTATNPDTPSIDAADAVPGSYKSIEINLTHPIRLSQLAIGYWTKNKMPGTLVHVSSIAGHIAGIGAPLYFATKHGLHGFVRSLAKLRDTVGIRVSAVAPASVKTPLWTEAAGMKHLMDAGIGEEITPETIAEAMLELCQNPEYGDGTILEVTLEHKRVVPLFNADPPPPSAIENPVFATVTMELLERLKTKGIDV
ncbi:short chain dehydrogenase [Xylaria bambusicola]|uniref:short chain dehydrogenase n=1 Tax=Xylaria bambusicola TaxID=326684 RepID=UPI002008380E|nr:short chain dehydrogenase [Xylaria bambusicola]KAI0509566.1 short chain dehydrogenase [Xylaria bambusicola]